MFVTVLIIIVKREKQPKCPSTDERINLVCPYNGILFSNNNTVLMSYKVLIHAIIRY